MGTRDRADPAELLEDGEIEVSWSIHSDQGLTMGGWNIDDVGVYQLTAGGTDTGDVDLPGDADDVAGENGELSACGCASTTPAPAGLAVLGLVGLALVRRRQD